MTFQECVQQCFANKELVKQFDRLWGTSLSSRGLDLAVDIATGKFADDAKAFFAFVEEYVWRRL